MSTAADHITRALYLIGASSPVKPASPQVIQSSLESLNDLVARWVEQGVEVGIVPAESTGDDLQLEQWAKPALEYNLAVELAPLLQVEPSSVVVAKAERYWSELRERARLGAVIPDRVEPDGRLGRGSGNVRGRTYSARFYRGSK